MSRNRKEKINNTSTTTVIQIPDFLDIVLTITVIV